VQRAVFFSFATFTRRCFVKHIYSKDRKP
jgi:hypothetical protein